MQLDLLFVCTIFQSATILFKTFLVISLMTKLLKWKFKEMSVRIIYKILQGMSKNEKSINVHLAGGDRKKSKK